MKDEVDLNFDISVEKIAKEAVDEKELSLHATLTKMHQTLPKLLQRKNTHLNRKKTKEIEDFKFSPNNTYDKYLKPSQTPKALVRPTSLNAKSLRDQLSRNEFKDCQTVASQGQPLNRFLNAQSRANILENKRAFHDNSKSFRTKPQTVVSGETLTHIASNMDK